MYRYNVVKEKLFHRDIGEYTAYGISVTDGKSVTRTVSDVSVNESFVNELVRKLNEGQAAPEQLTDIIEDAIV